MLESNEKALSEFAEFLLKHKSAREVEAPHMVRWVRQFLAVRPEPGLSLDDRIEAFVEYRHSAWGCSDWQMEQARRSIRMYFLNFLDKSGTEIERPVAVSPDGDVDPTAVKDAMRRLLRVKHYSYRTEQTYTEWWGRFVDYCRQVDADDGKREIRVTAQLIKTYLTHLATRRNVAAATQNQAFCALLFAWRNVLGNMDDSLGAGVRARGGRKLPTVLTVSEVRDLLNELKGCNRLMAELIYGGGLRVLECCRLRVKDVDFDQGLLYVRAGKGDKDRSTLLADSARAALQAHLKSVADRHRADRKAGVGPVWLPHALDRKYPNAGIEWAWQYVFPARDLSTDPREGVVRRHHVTPSAIQTAVKQAVRRASIHKPASVHTLRHSFATHLLLHGVDIRQIQEYLGHQNVETTMVYTHVVRDLRSPARSPLDMLKDEDGKR